MKNRWIHSLLVLCLGAGTALASESFDADCRALTQAPHRLLGTPECDAALDYIEERLEDIGPDQLLIQQVPAAQAMVKRCEMLIEGNTNPIALVPMRGDGIFHPVTGPDGITGPLVFAGRGSEEDFMNLQVEGAIVVMDYSCTGGWMRAFRLGARALIFVRLSDVSRIDGHVVDASANVPRYFYDGDMALLPFGQTVTLHSTIIWEKTRTRNILAFFKGTGAHFEQDKDELVILAGRVDSYGDVPLQSRGARAAANCATLLQLAETIQKQRPRRHVLVAFFGGDAYGLGSSSAFYRTLENGPRNLSAWLDARVKTVENESAFLEQLDQQAGMDDLLSPGNPVYNEMLKLVRDKAKRHALEVQDVLVQKRTTLVEIQRGKAEGTPEDVQRLQDEVRDVWVPRKDAWNEVRRAIGGRQSLTGLSPAAAPLGLQLQDEIRQQTAQRRSELAEMRAWLRGDQAVKDLVGQYWIVMHVTPVLGDESPFWGMVMTGGSSLRSERDSTGVYGQLQRAVLDTTRDLGEAVLPDFVTATVDQSIPANGIFVRSPLQHSGEIGGLFGVYNFCFATCYETLAREGTPDDTLERLNVPRVKNQAQQVGRLLTGADGQAGLLDQPGLSLKRGIAPGCEYSIPEFKNNTLSGAMVMGSLSGGAIADTPMPGAVVQMRASRFNTLAHYVTKMPYAENWTVQITDANGAYSLGPVPENKWGGEIRGIAAQFDSNGLPVSISTTESGKNVRNRMNVIRCTSGWFPLPPMLEPYRSWEQQQSEDGVTLLSSLANSTIEAAKSLTETTDGVFAWYVSDREKGLKFFQLPFMAALNNGPEDSPDTNGTDVAGTGFPLTDDMSMLPAFRFGNDLWRLNESRLAMLREKNISDPSLAELQGRAEDLLLAAGEAGKNLQGEALATSSFWLSQKIYKHIRKTLDDLVFAVLILLGLSVPFAFALERVVIGSTTIYRQISWFTGIFALTFLTLYLSHPAFGIANTPMIIFLGFAIVIMSGLVIGIIMQKFEVELKAIQGMTSTVHNADVSKVSTFMAAVHMGISTMRRRPMRTTLTAVTIILLTFTILLFASFGTRLGIVKMFLEPSPGYSGVWIHKTGWGVLTRDTVDVIKGRWGQANPEHDSDVAICRRIWASTWSAVGPGIPVSKDGEKPLTGVRGVLGMDNDELQRRPDCAALFGTNLTGKVLLSIPVARSLNLKVGDGVVISGQRLTLAGLLDPAALSQLKDMDGSSVLPVDFTQMSWLPKTEGQDEQADTARRSYSAIPPDSVAVASADDVVRMGSEIFGVMLYTHDTDQATELADDLARSLPFPISATRENGVHLHLLGTVLAASGVRDLFFPILLGGLVIFGTMLGSVSDRQKEIYTFSALGLAPRHVATLFFAESVVYSLIGGMGGYLIAQATVKVMTVMAAHGITRVPELNVSSTNTISTILLVMVTVLASAIYPAIKASKSANPGLMRVWRPPAPTGNLLEMVFPFTVSEYDITGVVSFLKEHFDNYSDTGLGQFMASNVRLGRDTTGMLSLRADLALAPFDLGVSQSMELHSTPSEIPGIDEVFVRMERLSGQPKDWQRLNKAFLDDLRRQFLIWRSIPHETMELYRHRTLAMLGSQESAI